MKAQSLLHLLLVVFLVASSRAETTAKWEKLEGCTLMPNKYNDGDSFHVIHNGTEFLFRLYFVDCPESDLRFPQRVKEQADYFSMLPEKALELSRIAKEFTIAELQSPFTVVTCWQKALGSSLLQRYYAFVLTKNGSLDQLLVKNGLARVYGKRISLPDGMISTDYRQLLHEFEKLAKMEKRGGWNPDFNR